MINYAGCTGPQTCHAQLGHAATSSTFETMLRSSCMSFLCSYSSLQPAILLELWIIEATSRQQSENRPDPMLATPRCYWGRW